MRSQTPWREDPALSFHADFPDDLQIILHVGEPRRTNRSLELCWVRVTGLQQSLRFPTLATAPDSGPPLPPSAVDWTERPVYRGTLLNQPHQLSLHQGDPVLFASVSGLPHPLAVSAEYLQERPRWAFVPCDRCGSDQALDPPSVMAATRFPSAEGQVLMFTAFCVCGGTQMLVAVE